MNEIGIDLKEHIRTIPDWPKKGVMFRDISSLLEDRLVFRKLIDLFVHRYFTTTIEAAAIIDLPDLGGSRRLREAGLAVHSFCAFAGE